LESVKAHWDVEVVALDAPLHTRVTHTSG